ncbi:MAG: hypothetical protein ACRYFS_15495 [Janthinobacterium lividum]
MVLLLPSRVYVRVARAHGIVTVCDFRLVYEPRPPAVSFSASTEGSRSKRGNGSDYGRRCEKRRPKRHILLSVRAFVRLEAHRLQTGSSGYAAKAGLIREAIRLYSQQLTIILVTTA